MGYHRHREDHAQNFRATGCARDYECRVASTTALLGLEGQFCRKIPSWRIAAAVIPANETPCRNKSH